MLTKKQKKAAKKAYKDLGWYDEQMDYLLGDPATYAMGVPVNDFAEKWDREYRHMIWKHLQNPNQPQCMKEVLWAEVERWMP